MARTRIGLTEQYRRTDNFYVDVPEKSQIHRVLSLSRQCCHGIEKLVRQFFRPFDLATDSQYTHARQ